MKMLRTILMLCVIAASTAASSQNKIEFKIEGAEDSTMYLIRYYGDKLFYADTAQADKSGKFSFDDSWANKPGMYSVMAPSQKRFDILLNKEDVYIETNMKDFVKFMNIKKSKENTLFYGFIKELNNKRQERERIQKTMDQQPDGAKKEALQKRLKELDGGAMSFQKEFVEKNEGTLAAKVVKMSMEIEVPDPPKDENGVVTDSSFQRNYYITHYWDHFDLTDDATIRMAGYQKRLERLYDEVLVKHQDSLINYSERLISKLDPKSELFKFTVVHLTSKYQQSKIMCLDAVFVHMVLTYYKTGMAYWMPEDKNKEIVERAEAMAPNICNVKIHPISLMTREDTWLPLDSLDNKYVVLMFWSPDCGHCKKEMPKLIEKYEGWQKDSIDVEIYGVSSKNGKEWTDFLDEKKLEWINVAVPQQVYESQEYVNKIVRSGVTDIKSLNYHDTYDVYKTPTIYLLNKDRIIIGKNLEAEGLDDLIRKLQERE